MPVGLLDLLPPDWPEPRVRHQFVRPGEHADGVELDSPNPPQHPGDTAPPPVPAQEPLSEKGDPPHFVWSQIPAIQNGRGILSHAPDCIEGV